MGNAFALRLAVQNLKSNRRFYLPYLLSGVLTLALYFIMGNLAASESLANIRGGGSMQTILGFGTAITAILTVILLLYANSFLMKRRRTEFALYTVLGMEKRHLARVMSWETGLCFLVSLALGLGAGFLLQQLLFLILLRIIALPVTFSIGFSAAVAGRSALLAAGTFLVTLIWNLFSILRESAVSLFQGAKAGEREPKAKWLLALIGGALLLAGYAMALLIQNPVKALGSFFLAVILVIGGTYALFTAGSVVLLKALRKNKKYYYHPRHFTAVSGLMYRMKQNAVGLASICILSAGVLLMVSTTVSMYIGMDDLLNNRFARDIMIYRYDMYDDDPDADPAALEAEAVSTLEALAARYGVTLTDPEEYRMRDVTFWSQDGTESRVTVVNALPLSEYVRLSGRDVTLGPGEVLVYDRAGAFSGASLTLGDETFSVQQVLSEFPLREASQKEIWMAADYDTYYVVFPDEDSIIGLCERWRQKTAPDNMPIRDLRWYYSCDLAGADRSTLIDFSLDARTQVMGLGNLDIDAKYESQASFFAMYGSLLFIGVFLGLLFFGATALIIYYKQVSEGYEDCQRYRIMQQVGMSRDEVKKSIHSQILIVFFLPLAAAVVHMAVCFPMLTKILQMMNLTNVPLFLACLVGTVLLFAALYALVYALTARVYYRIVRAA